MRRANYLSVWALAGVVAFLMPGITRAQQPNERSSTEKATLADTGGASQARLHEKFQTLLSGSKLRGQFTMDGKPLQDLHEEAYDILNVEKLPDGDMWALTTRIKYGKHDLTVPIAVQVKWAGSTPVITLDNLTIPGLGTFSARVLFHKDKYAGTWQHDNVGGHLFGKVELAEEPKK